MSGLAAIAAAANEAIVNPMPNSPPPSSRSTNSGTVTSVTPMLVKNTSVTAVTTTNGSVTMRVRAMRR